MKFESFKDLAGRKIWPAAAQLHIRHKTTTRPWWSVPLPIFFEVAFKSRFSSTWSLRCSATSSSFDERRAVFFSYRARPWKPRPRTQTSFSLQARSTFYSSLNCRSNKGLVNIAISKKKAAKRRSWCVPGPLKRGQGHFSCPLLSGPGKHSTHHRAHMVYSSPCADVADWSMP